MLSKAVRLASIFKTTFVHACPPLPIQQSTMVFRPLNFFCTALPKHKKLTMPSLSPTMEKGNILKYLFKEGDKISAGDVLCEVETDKATVGFEVQEEGYIAKILLPEGSKDVPIGELVAIIVPKKDGLAAFSNYKPDQSEPKKATPPPPTAATTQATTTTTATPPPPATSGGSGKTYPKHHKLGLPSLSPTMEKGTVMKWLVQVGSEISAGDVICEVETDKATVGFEVQEHGFIAKILIPEGTKDIELGTVLAIAVLKKEQIPEFADYTIESGNGQSVTQSQPAQQQKQQPKQEQQQQQQTKQQPKQEQQQPKAHDGTRLFVSPLARIFAREQGVSLDGITGTGIDGSITKKDVELFISKGGVASHHEQKGGAACPSEQKQQQQQAPPAATEKKAAPKQTKAPAVVEGNPYVDTELTNMRLTIASRLLESKTTIPHYYLTMAIKMDNVLKLREELNKVSKSKISVNDFLIKASALALRDIPQVNSQWCGKYIRKYANADVSVAVATEAGLITPIVFNAAAKGLTQIASTTKQLAEKAKANKLQPAEFVGGTFTISNLGMFGIDQFVAVINPPQAAILAVGTTNKVLVPDEKGESKVESRMNVTLSCDHRVVDGAVGAQWLQRFKIYLEDPNTMLL